MLAPWQAGATRARLPPRLGGVDAGGGAAPRRVTAFAQCMPRSSWACLAAAASRVWALQERLCESCRLPPSVAEQARTA